jgi:hypothetical protein
MQSARVNPKLPVPEFVSTMAQRTFNERELRNFTDKIGRQKSVESKGSKSKQRSTSQEKRGTSKPKKID